MKAVADSETLSERHFCVIYFLHIQNNVYETVDNLYYTVLSDEIAYSTTSMNYINTFLNKFNFIRGIYVEHISVLGDEVGF